MVATIVELNPHALIDEKGPTEVVKGQATAIEELLVTEEVMGQAEEIVMLLFAEPEVTKGQATDEDEDKLTPVRVAEAAYLELAEIEANGQAEPLVAITLLLVATVKVLLNTGQTHAGLVATVEFEIFL